MDSVNMITAFVNQCGMPFACYISLYLLLRGELQELNQRLDNLTVAVTKLIERETKDEKNRA